MGGRRGSFTQRQPCSEAIEAYLRFEEAGPSLCSFIGPPPLVQHDDVSHTQTYGGMGFVSEAWRAWQTHLKKKPKQRGGNLVSGQAQPNSRGRAGRGQPTTAGGVLGPIRLQKQFVDFLSTSCRTKIRKI